MIFFLHQIQLVFLHDFRARFHARNCPAIYPHWISQPIHSIARFPHPFRMAHFQPFFPLVPDPVNATPIHPIVDAVCLSEVTNRNNSAPIHGPILPDSLPDLITSLYNPTPIPSHYNNTIATLATRSYTTSAPHGMGVRNLFVGRRATAVAPYPTQPRLQAKSISVALPTARQTRFMPFLLYCALRPPNVVCFPIMSYGRSYASLYCLLSSLSILETLLEF